MNEKYSAQERLCAEIRMLCENHVNGLANKELAVSVGTSEANVCRDLDVLKKFRWVIRDDKSRWHLSPEFGGISGQIIKSYQKAKLRLSQEEERYLTAM